MIIFPLQKHVIPLSLEKYEYLQARDEKFYTIIFSKEKKEENQTSNESFHKLAVYCRG